MARKEEQIDIGNPQAQKRTRKRSAKLVTEKAPLVPKMKLTKKILTEMGKLAGYGLTMTQIMDYFEITPPEWEKMRQYYPEMVVAIRQGKAKRIAFAGKKLNDLIEEGDRTALIFYLKAQAGWRDRDPVQDSGDSKLNFPSITLPKKDPLEAAKIYQEIMQGS